MLHTKSVLKGSFTKLPDIEQLALIKMFCLASEAEPRRGYLEYSPNNPYPVSEIANQCRMSIEVIQSTIQHCMEDKNFDGNGSRMEQLPDGTLYFGNWEKYNKNQKPKRLAETEEERELREQRLQSQYNRKYPDKAPVKTVTVTVKEDGEILNKTEEITQTRKVK
jgi:hypothetical protein